MLLKILARPLHANVDYFIIYRTLTRSVTKAFSMQSHA